MTDSTLPLDLDGMLARIDGLLGDTEDFERFRLGLGIKLALGMARELKQGKPLGHETGAWVLGWQKEFGPESTEKAIAIAREFLLNPDKLRKTFAERLGMQSGMREDTDSGMQGASSEDDFGDESR
jgi:hypothetical protein